MSKNEDFETFRVSNEREQIDFIAKILDDNDIEYDIDYGAPVDGGILSGSVAVDYYLKIARTDFEKVEALLQQANGETDASSIDENHPFFAFSKEELTDVVRQPYEWDTTDYQLALQILKKQGVTFTDDEIQRYKDEHIARLAQPRSNNGVVGFGYFLTIFGILINFLALYHIFNKEEITPLYSIMAGLAWMIGLVMGKSCLVTKILPNGKKVPVFNEKCHHHGRRIMLLSFVLLAITVVQFALWLLK